MMSAPGVGLHGEKTEVTVLVFGGAVHFQQDLDDLIKNILICRDRLLPNSSEEAKAIGIGAKVDIEGMN
jgi:hypothetical protein